MQIALREMDRLNTTITEFLIYAKPAPLQKKPMNINDLLLDAINLLKNSDLFRNSNVSIQTEFKENNLISHVDPHQISQVFWNLSLNALQSMSNGGVLTISSRKSMMRKFDMITPAKEWLEIIFRDTGDGISEEIIDKIFLPFFTTKEGGSGLGLPIVHRIVEEHSGRVYVKSTHGKGTQFTLYLPEV